MSEHYSQVWVFLIISRPRTVAEKLRTAATRLLQWWVPDHVTFGDDRLAMDVCMNGVAFYPMGMFRRYARGVVRVYGIRTPHPAPIPIWRAGSKPKTLPVVLSFITRGWFKCDDCVQTCTSALREAGVPIPRHVVTPKQLDHELGKIAHTMIEGPHAR